VPGRTLAIGDIHGCHTALDTLLDQLKIHADDTVVLLGDVVDRGPGTRQVIERLLELQSQCRLVFVRGNHEEMLLDGIEGEGRYWNIWLMNGGWEALQSYGGERQIPEPHVEFLRSSIDYFETEKEVYVHANLEPGVPLEVQTAEWLRWTRFTGREPALPTGQRVVCGHTPQSSGLPTRTAGWACIDTLAFAAGWLTALDVETEEIFQADQQGRFRTGILS